MTTSIYEIQDRLTGEIIDERFVYSFDGQPVSQFAKVGDRQNDNQATDFHSGLIHTNLSRGDALRLAKQIAVFHAYTHLIGSQTKKD